MNKVPHKVFICYASQDTAVAEAVCGALEASHIKCWIAPRDVLPGTEWAETIVDALDESQVIVLILSSYSNTSPQVIREVGRAASNGIPIIPFRIDNVSPSKAMDFFISRHHFLDALTPPIEKHLQRLTETTQQILSRKGIPGEDIEIAEAEERARREAEEKARKEAEEKARKEAEEARKAKEAEEKEKRETEARAKKEAEEKAKKEAEEARKAKEAEEKEKREAEARTKKEAEEKARKEAEEARKAKEGETKAKKEAEKAAREREKRESKEAAGVHAEAVKAKAPLLKQWWVWSGGGVVLVVIIFLLVFLLRDTAEAHYNSGAALLEEGQYEEAIAEFCKAIEMNPDYAIAYHDRGLVYCYREEYNLAVEDLNTARQLNPDIEINPSFAIACHEHGLICSSQDDYDQALADLALALELNPDIDVDNKYADVYCCHGLTHSEQGSYEQAIADFNQAIELRPYAPDFYYARGYAYYKLGDPDMATADLEKCLDLYYDPDRAKKARELLGEIAIAGLPSKPAFEDDFSSSTSDWGTYYGEDNENYYDNGKYHMRGNTSNLAHFLKNQNAGQYTDFALVIDARLVSGSYTCSYGVIFRLQDYDNLYCVLINGNSSYQVYKLLNDKWYALKTWTKSDYINGGNSTNHIMVICQDSKIKVYINGYYIDTITDSSFSKGYVGLMIEVQQASVHAAFDDIKVYRLD